MPYKTYIPSLVLKELYVTISASESILSEEIYWYLVENEYFAIGKLAGNSLKDRLLSVDWNCHPSPSLRSSPSVRFSEEPVNQSDNLTWKERMLVNVLAAIWALLLILFLYWAWKHIPLSLFRP